MYKKYSFIKKSNKLSIITTMLLLAVMVTAISISETAKAASLSKPVIYAQKVTYNKLKINVESAISGATSYKYYRSTSKLGNYKYITTSSSQYIYDRDLQTNTRYYYKVIAYGAGGIRSSASEPRSAKPTLNPIANMHRYMKLKTITLKWTDIPGASGYKVYRAASASSSYKHIANVSSRTYANSGLANNEDYYYKIKPFRKQSSGVTYGAVSFARRAVTPMTAGRYKISTGGIFKLQTNGDAYFSTCTNASCDWALSYDTNDSFQNTAYVKVASGTYLDFETYGKKGSIKRLTKGSSPAYGYYDDVFTVYGGFSKPGYFWAGIDIQPGTYKISGSDYYYWAICSDLPCESSNIVDNNIRSSGGTDYFDIYSGEILDVSSFNSIVGVKQ